MINNRMLDHRLEDGSERFHSLCVWISDRFYNRLLRESPWEAGSDGSEPTAWLAFVS